MRVDLFDFDLPEDRIALRPVDPREAAKLLEVQPDGVFLDHRVGDIVDLLNPGDRLVVNDTRVVPARLYGLRGEVPIEATLHQALGAGSSETTRWSAFAKPGKRLKVGHEVIFADTLMATVVEKRDGGEVILDFAVPQTAFIGMLEKIGEMPLPPYIAAKRTPDDQDKQDYQTTFAEKDGAVAAPTAGLHFTNQLINKLTNKGIEITRVTLHVGAGTFLPVKAEDTDDHKMHSEWGRITAAQAEEINATRALGGRIIAIGTTSLRILEAAGSENGVQPFEGDTDIFITPGYRFKSVDMLWTNFHLPKSTLMMLVSAFAGFKNMQAAYQHAIDNKYRFYSYGDASLLHLHDGAEDFAE